MIKPILNFIHRDCTKHIHALENRIALLERDARRDMDQVYHIGQNLVDANCEIVKLERELAKRNEEIREIKSEALSND